MAYQELIITDQKDFLVRLRTFMLDSGWLEDQWDPVGVSGYYQLLMHHADTYIFLQMGVGGNGVGPYIYAATGYNGTPTTPLDQTAFVERSRQVHDSIPVIYIEPTPAWFFSYDNPDGSKQIHIVYQPPVLGGVVSYITFGKVEAAYGTTGSRNYMGVTCYNGGDSNQPILGNQGYYARGPGFSAHMSNDIRDRQWFCNGYGESQYDLTSLSGGFGMAGNYFDRVNEVDNFLYYGLNTWATRMSAAQHVPTTPAMFFIDYEDRTRKFIAGSIPNLRFVNCVMFDVGENTTVGSDEYAIFPTTVKTAFNFSDSTAKYQPGFALRIER